MSKVIVGLDLSLVHTGVGIVVDSDFATSFGIVPKEKGVLRLCYVRDAIKELLSSVPQDTSIAIEGYSFGSIGNAIYGIGELGGVIRLLCFDMSFSVRIVPPTVVKKFACGKGNAAKKVVVETYNQIYQTQFRLKDNNEVDALCLARILYYHLSRDVVLLQYQREVIERVDETCKVLF